MENCSKHNLVFACNFSVVFTPPGRLIVHYTMLAWVHSSFESVFYNAVFALISASNFIHFTFCNLYLLLKFEWTYRNKTAMPAGLSVFFYLDISKCHKTGKFPLPLVYPCPMLVLRKAWPRQHPSSCVGLGVSTRVLPWSQVRMLPMRVLLGDPQAAEPRSPSSAFSPPIPSRGEKWDFTLQRGCLGSGGSAPLCWW